MTMAASTSTPARMVAQTPAPLTAHVRSTTAALENGTPWQRWGSAAKGGLGMREGAWGAVAVAAAVER